MLTDARTLASGSRFDVDLCIIGGGAAGITIAMELIDSGLRILLVESGGTDPDKATHDLAAGESIGRPATTLDTPVRLDQMRLRWGLKSLFCSTARDCRRTLPCMCRLRGSRRR